MTTIQLRRDTAANWASKNPVLAAGEMGIETDTNLFKFGNGLTTWNNLAYVTTGSSTEITANLPLVVTDGTLSLKIDSTNLQVNSNGELTVNLDELGNEVNDLSGRVTANEADITTIQNEITELTGEVENKQDKLTAGNGINLDNNAIGINQGIAGFEGLGINTVDTAGATVTYNDNGITFDKGAYGHVVFPNKGGGNNYEIVLYPQYLGDHSSRNDCKILGIAGTATNTYTVNWDNKKGCLYVDTYGTLYSFVNTNNGSSTDGRHSTGTIAIVKYIIQGTTATVYTGTSLDNLTQVASISLDSTGYIIFFIGNSIFSPDNTNGNAWVGVNLSYDSYILDKTTNTILMSKGINENGVAIATNNKFGLVRPDNNTITVTNGVIKANIPEVDTSKFVTTDTEQTITGIKTFPERTKFTKRIVLTGDLTRIQNEYGNVLFLDDVTNKTIQIGEPNRTTILSNTVQDSSGNIFLKQNTVTAGDNISIKQTDTGIEISSTGGVTPLSYIEEVYVNGTSGYRIWSKDSTGYRYCEQWGFNNTGTSDDITLSLLKPFRDTAYNLQLTSTQGTGVISSKTTKQTSTITVKSSSSNFFDWQAQGYIAD